MPIIKNTNNSLRAQVRSQYAVDRVAKSIFCIPYVIDKPGVRPAEGKISLTPTNKPSQTTSIELNVTTITGASLLELFNFYTEGSLIISERAIAENFAAFKVGSRTIAADNQTVTFEIPTILASDAISIFPENSQVCLQIGPAPTSEALTIVDGGYY